MSEAIGKALTVLRIASVAHDASDDGDVHEAHEALDRGATFAFRGEAVDANGEDGAAVIHEPPAPTVIALAFHDEVHAGSRPVHGRSDGPVDALRRLFHRKMNFTGKIADHASRALIENAGGGLRSAVILFPGVDSAREAWIASRSAHG